MNILVTGGCGFIGTVLCKKLLAEGHHVLVLDKATYAADMRTAEELDTLPEYNLVVGDVCDSWLVLGLLKMFKVDMVMHLAAESHVDRSISGPQSFLDANVLGTYGVLEAVRAYLPMAPGHFRLVQVSTDEVFGDTAVDSLELFTEESPYRPSNPYSVSKASADWLVRSWGRTFNVPWIITHGANTYGPGQLPDKLVPMTIVNGISGKPVTLHGTGRNKRSWVHVKDHVNGILDAAFYGTLGNSYCIDAGQELSNCQMVVQICERLRSAGYAPTIEIVQDRPGNDMRYAMDSTKLRQATGWQPQVDLPSGLAETITWYINAKENVNV